MHNKKVIYTPEITTITKGTPVTGTVVGTSFNLQEYTLLLDDGSEIKADKKHIEVCND